MDVDDVADDSTGGPDRGSNCAVVEVDWHHRATQLLGIADKWFVSLFEVAQVGGIQTEGVKDPLPESLVIRLAGDLFCKQSEDHVVGVGVLESRTGLEIHAVVFDESVEPLGCPGCGVAVLGVSVDGVLCVIGQSGSLTQQMANSDIFWEGEAREIGGCGGIEVN